jgi:prevent-host-death family protein
MRKVGSRKFKNGMGSYMRAVRNGETLLITIRGKVVARISPLEDTKRTPSALTRD